MIYVHIYIDICRSKSTEYIQYCGHKGLQFTSFLLLHNLEYLQSEFMNSQQTKMDHPFLVPTQLWINHVTMLVAPKKTPQSWLPQVNPPQSCCIPATIIFKAMRGNNFHLSKSSTKSMWSKKTKYVLNQNSTIWGVFSICYHECSWFRKWFFPFHHIIHCTTILPGRTKKITAKDCKKINKNHEYRPWKTWAQLNGCMIQKLAPLQPTTKNDVSGMFYHQQKLNNKKTTT